MENPFSFIKDDAPKKSVRSTRRQSIRQMKYASLYQKNITACVTEVLQKKYVGKLGAHWTFPSDHLPVGAEIENFRVASWNILNEAYLFWIARDAQGLASSLMLKPKNRVRGELIIQISLSMMEHPTHPKQLLALQECSPLFLSALEDTLPAHFDLIYRHEEGVQNLLAILYDKRHFTYQSVSYTFPFSTDPNKEVMTLVLSHGGKEFRFVNVHIPGDPASPARFEFVEHINQGAQKNMVILGDMNFTEWEMNDAFIRRTENFKRCENGYPTNVGCDLYAKQIDHIYTERDLKTSALLPEEVLLSLKPHVELITAEQSNQGLSLL